MKKNDQYILMRFIKVAALIFFIIMTFSACNQSIITKGVLDYDVFQTYVDSQTVIKAKVINITGNDIVSEDYYGTMITTQTITFTSVILEKDLKDQIINCRQTIDSQSYKVNEIKKNNLIYIFPSYEDGYPIGDFIEYSRTDQLIWFFALFAAVIIIFSRLKGLRALIALVLTCLAIFFVFIPAIKNGYSPIASAILISVLITIATLAIVFGINRKSISAALGCFLGILIAGILAYIMQKTMNMSGLSDENSIMLSISYDFNMKGTIFAAVIIGALGATMDVAVSIASSLEEIIKHSQEKLSGYQIIKSGMKIGADIMGTMTNTLILAYVGSSLPLIILLSLNSSNLGYAISWEMISEEFLKALAGSIGLVFVVPATSTMTSVLFSKKQGDNIISENFLTQSDEEKSI